MTVSTITFFVFWKQPIIKVIYFKTLNFCILKSSLGYIRKTIIVYNILLNTNSIKKTFSKLIIYSVAKKPGFLEKPWIWQYRLKILKC